MKKRIYIFSRGVLKREGNTLCLHTQRGKKYVPVKDVAEIHVFGEIRFNKRLLEFLTANRITLHIYNHFGFYSGSYYPRRHYNSGFMVLKQAEYYMDPNKRADLAKRFVWGSIGNMMKNLKYYEARIGGLSNIISYLEALSLEVEGASRAEELLGIEGNAKKVYYRSFNTILKGEIFSFKGREKRPPKNMVNALISFGNSLLYATVLNQIYQTHLDPRIGFLHTTNSRKFSLNLDVADVFKPILVDRIIFKVVNKGMIGEKDFVREMGGVFLRDKGRKTFSNEFEAKLGTTIKIRGRSFSYARIIRLELYKIEKHLIGEKEYEPFITRW